MQRMSQHELNFDGLVGPTHNYAGLSCGNLASMSHKNTASNPRKAALEGLAKMKFLADLGVKQAVLPPHERPHLPTLRRLGFSGSDAEVLASVKETDPTLLAAASSASAMWAANAATVSASVDSADGRVHFTPANLVSTFHRSIETETTARILKRDFRRRETLRASRTAAEWVELLGRRGRQPHPALGRSEIARPAYLHLWP